MYCATTMMIITTLHATITVASAFHTFHSKPHLTHSSSTQIKWSLPSSSFRLSNSKTKPFPKIPSLSTTTASSSSLLFMTNKEGDNQKTTKTTTTATTSDSYTEPEESKSNFGRKDYWNDVYNHEKEFSWYSNWEDLEPFFDEILEDHCLVDATNNNEEEDETMIGLKDKYDAKILIPGIGNDSAMVHMYDAGYKYMTAFDYAKEGVESAKEIFGPDRIHPNDKSDEKNDVKERKDSHGVILDVADARNLPYPSNSFDAVLEKGTLDAVYLSGGSDKKLASHHLSMAISELSRVVKSGGIVFSVTAACVDAIQTAFDREVEDHGSWVQLKDGSVYMTSEGYTSNNVDATMLVWKRL